MMGADPADRRHGSRYRNRGPAAREGWGAALLSLVTAIVTCGLISASATSLEGAVLRVEIGAVLVLVAGIGVGVERLIAVATAPTLAGAVIAFVGTDDLLLGRSLVVGCLWYVAVEAALASVERRDGVRRTTAVARARINEVATVVAVASLVGGVGVSLVVIAPERTVLMRLLGLGALVITLIWALRQVLRSSTNPAH